MTYRNSIEAESETRLHELADEREEGGKMSTQEASMSEKSVLRWGGLAGMLGGVLPVLFFVLAAVFLPAGYARVTAVEGFPAARAATIAVQLVYLASIICWIFLFLALYRALRGGRSFAPALFGCGVGLVGLALLATGGISAIAFGHISSLYHASSATVQDKAALALVWQGIQAVFNETDTVGGILFAIGFILLGTAMLWNPAFSKSLGAVSIVFGLAGLTGVAFSSAGFAYALVVIVLPILLGWKIYTLPSAA
jgi:hypothetical protein